MYFSLLVLMNDQLLVQLMLVSIFMPFVSETKLSKRDNKFIPLLL